MSNIRITKEFSFETGHALYGYDGKCKNVHGHSYKLSVTVIGVPITDRTNVKFGMVIDFSDLKKIVKEEIVDHFDHATVFNETTPHIELANELKNRVDIMLYLVDYQPTSENMVIDFAKKIKSRLPDPYQIAFVEITRNRFFFCRMVCQRQFIIENSLH
jgi:6-pyruvoyltetrahydropterin/6-carboxytetrahydropterin synthase